MIVVCICSLVERDLLRNLLLRLGDGATDSLQGRLDVVAQHFFFFLRLALLIERNDVGQIFLLLLKEALRIVHSVIELNVAPVLLSLEVHVVEQLDKPLVELGELNLRRAVLNLALDGSDIPVLLCDESALLHESLMLFIELSIDLDQNRGVLVCLELLLSHFHLLKLFIKALLLFLAFLLELRLLLGERHLLFDHRLHDHDFVLLHIALVNLRFEDLGLTGYFVDLLLVLLALVLELSDLFLGCGGQLFELFPLLRLLFNAPSEVRNFLVILLLLLLVL